jgi:hippurate hydrolase
MLLRVLVVAAVSAVAFPLVAQSPAAHSDLAASAERQLPALTETYKHLHRNPELSRHEEQTSAYLARELRKLGYTVTEHVGKYTDGGQGFGVVAVLENGAGPRLLIRTDMDALPVEEKTGLDYASTVKSVNAQGQPVGVMHACGHDLHMTVLLGTARELASRKSEWHGTLMLIGQPAEEIIQGAAAMMADHLYERFGKPDFVISEHDSPDVPAGSIAVKGGPLMAGSTTINVTMRGIGGHGSRPEVGKDPIVLAAEFVLVAQTIVSRQIDPQQPDEDQHHPRRGDDGTHAAHLLACGARPDCGRRAPHREWVGGGLRNSGGPHADGDPGRRHARHHQRPGPGRAGAHGCRGCAGQGARS